jgi:cytochrome c-type protein NapC
VQATHDAKKLYLRFEWESAEGDAGPVLDPRNEVKLTVMFDGGRVDGARLNGCWATCHMDLRTMPDAAPGASRHPKAKALGWGDGVTKYIAESRTPPADPGKARGAWDKLRPPREIAAALKAGQFLDLMQFRSGAGEKPVDGYVLERRHMGGGKSLIGATGQRNGRKWTVTFERLLAAGGVGDHALRPGRQYTFGVSIHENHGAARFHHVSLGYTLGLDDTTAFVNATPAGDAPAQHAQAGATPAMR